MCKHQYKANATQEPSLFFQDDPSSSSFLPHGYKTQKIELKKGRLKTYNERGRAALLFPPTKYAMVPQHGPFSLHTTLENPWIHKVTIQTPMAS